MHLQRSPLLFIVLFAAALACANPSSGGGNAPFNVETIVAGTLQALTAHAPQDPASELLPFSIYFLNNDSAGLVQVYRLERDGKTVSQVTFERLKVTDYDVSPLDGSVVYVSNNQLLNIRADGSNRVLLVDGGPLNANEPFMNSIRSPVWSPNGQTIAFGYNGLSFYSVISGQSNLVLENLVDNDLGFPFPRELYWPEKYTSDGSKLVITLGYFEGASAAIYYPNGNALVRMKGGEGTAICCGKIEWTADGSAFYAANPTTGLVDAGLWRVDAATGNVTALLAGSAYLDPANLAEAPFPAPDGKLYFFFASLANADRNEFPRGAPLQLVRSALDGVTGRTVLRPETFQSINEALWAPDASFVILAIAPIEEIYEGGVAELVYTNGGKPIVPLLSFAMQMKWGP